MKRDFNRIFRAAVDKLKMIFNKRLFIGCWLLILYFFCLTTVVFSLSAYLFQTKLTSITKKDSNNQILHAAPLARKSGSKTSTNQRYSSGEILLRYQLWSGKRWQLESNELMLEALVDQRHMLNQQLRKLNSELYTDIMRGIKRPENAAGSKGEKNQTLSPAERQRLDRKFMEVLDLLATTDITAKAKEVRNALSKFAVSQEGVEGMLIEKQREIQKLFRDLEKMIDTHTEVKEILQQPEMVDVGKIAFLKQELLMTEDTIEGLERERKDLLLRHLEGMGGGVQQRKLPDSTVEDIDTYPPEIHVGDDAGSRSREPKNGQSTTEQDIVTDPDLGDVFVEIEHFEKFFAPISAKLEKFTVGFIVVSNYWSFPQPILKINLILSMGILGSLIFVTIEFIKEPKDVLQHSLVMYLFRPFLGVIVALAMYVMVKSGQTQLIGDSESNLSPFFISFLGIISGLLAEQAYKRIKYTGGQVLHTSGEMDAKSPSSPQQSTENGRQQ
jgi:hypothetical protein